MWYSINENRVWNDSSLFMTTAESMATSQSPSLLRVSWDWGLPCYVIVEDRSVSIGRPREEGRVRISEDSSWDVRWLLFSGLLISNEITPRFVLAIEGELLLIGINWRGLSKDASAFLFSVNLKKIPMGLKSHDTPGLFKFEIPCWKVSKSQLLRVWAHHVEEIFSAGINLPWKDCIQVMLCLHRIVWIQRRWRKHHSSCRSFQIQQGFCSLWQWVEEWQ